MTRRRTARVDVVEHGPRDGPEVLLVHGIGVSRRYFGPLVDLLSRTHRVLTPDLPGFGSSGRPDPALDVGEQASAMEGVLDRADMHRPVLLGHSMGSQVVTEMALRRPGRTRGVVLVGPVVDPEAPTTVAQSARLARDTVAEPPELAAVVVQDYVRGGLRSYRQTLPHMLGYPLVRRVADLTVPVVVVRGSRDPITSRHFVETLAAAARRGTWREVPGARHLAMTTRPGDVALACWTFDG